jgi:peptide/nickel transport system ATP-binding protein
MSLLSVIHLSVEYPSDNGHLRVVDDVSFSIEPGEILALIGESGCGKSVACRAILRLLPGRHGRIASGRIDLAGRDIARLPEAELIAYRGRQIALIFQNAETFFDPAMTIGEQLSEPLEFHEGLGRGESRRLILDLLEQVGIPDGQHCLDRLPRQLSAGMRWRAMVAAGLSRSPKLLIVDEPGAGLDTTVRAQIVRLLLDIRDRTGIAIILLTHDLGSVAQICDSVAVMYAGRIVERAPKSELLRQPLHPYSEALLHARPDARATGDGLLPELRGEPPSLADLPRGCRFHPRCPYADDACRFGDVQLTEVSSWRATACRHWDRMMSGVSS